MSNILVQNIKHTNNTTAIEINSSAQMAVKSDGGAKIVMQSGDALKVKSNTASSADVWVSVVDAIST